MYEKSFKQGKGKKEISKINKSGLQKPQGTGGQRRKTLTSPYEFTDGPMDGPTDGPMDRQRITWSRYPASEKTKQKKIHMKGKDEADLLSFLQNKHEFLQFPLR